MEDQCLIRDSDLDTGPQEKCDSNVYDCVCVWQGGGGEELQDIISFCPQVIMPYLLFMKFK